MAFRSHHRDMFLSRARHTGPFPTTPLAPDLHDAAGTHERRLAAARRVAVGRRAGACGGAAGAPAPELGAVHRAQQLEARVAERREGRRIDWCSRRAAPRLAALAPASSVCLCARMTVLVLVLVCSPSLRVCACLWC